MSDEESQGVQAEETLPDPQARPLVDEKHERRTYGLIRRAREAGTLQRGVRAVRRAMKRGQRGLLVIAGDTQPFDIVAALPVMAERLGLPYYFVRSRRLLAAASGNKFTATVALVGDPGEGPGRRRFAQLCKEAKVLGEREDGVLVCE